MIFPESKHICMNAPKEETTLLSTIYTIQKKTKEEENFRLSARETTSLLVCSVDSYILMKFKLTVTILNLC